MSHLTGTTVAFLSTDGFEDSELTSPWEAVTTHGATAVLVAPESGTITGKNGHEATVDRTTSQVSADDFDALVLPGGVVNADHLRLDSGAVELVKDLVAQHKPVAVICHGGWILTDADVIAGRTLTSYPSLRTDLVNAGATWVDQEVVVDDGLISSRTPDDLPAFNEALLEAFSEKAVAHGS